MMVAGLMRTQTMLTHAVSTDLESVASAQRRLLEQVGVLAPETVSLEKALGRVLAEPISSRSDLPGFDNSAMDGYAVRAGDIAQATARAPVHLPVAGESRAGAVPDAHVAGTAMRIMTGAPMPPGADTVVRQEDTSRDGPTVLIEVATPLATSVRPRGADMRVGRDDVGQMDETAVAGPHDRDLMVARVTTGHDRAQPRDHLGVTYGRFDHRGDRIETFGRVTIGGAQPFVTAFARDLQFAIQSLALGDFT